MTTAGATPAVVGSVCRATARKGGKLSTKVSAAMSASRGIECVISFSPPGFVVQPRSGTRKLLLKGGHDTRRALEGGMICACKHPGGLVDRARVRREPTGETASASSLSVEASTRGAEDGTQGR